MSPHIQKKENWYESIMLLFFNTTDRRLFFSSILSLVVPFFHGASFLPQFFLHILYLWVWLSMLRLMLRLVLLVVVSEALCASVLTCTILVGQLNKIFGLITHTIKSLHVLYWVIFKNLLFWHDTNSKLAPGLHGGRLYDPHMGWINFL